jgi:hypothetical protein
VTVPGFLIDENLPPVIVSQLLRHEPSINAWSVGQAGAPPWGTPDPVLLEWIEDNECFLVTANRVSMPDHLSKHLAADRHIPGILVVLFPLDIGHLLEDLLLIRGAIQPDEFRDQIVYLPLRR